MASYSGQHTPINPALRNLKQKDGEFEISLGYIARACLKKQKQAECGGSCLKSQLLRMWELRIEIKGQPRQKVHKNPSQSIKVGCGGMCLHLTCMRSINRRIKV
jgi:hypothetical protein